MVVLKAEQSFLTMQDSVNTTSPLYLHKAGHGPTDFLNRDNSGTQYAKPELMIISDCLPCTFIPLMIGYINLFISMAMFSHGVEKLLYELKFSNNNKFCDVLLNIVD